MNSEMQSRKWLFAGIGLQLSTAYVLSFLVYQIGTLLTTGAVGVGFLPGLLVVAVIVAVIASLIIRTNRQMNTEYSLHQKVHAS